MKSALGGIIVLDLTRVLAGPYATMLLGDMGADIIKIEPPVVGDDSRQFGPYIEDESVYFMSLNRNKKSMTLNLKKEKGKEIFKEMIKRADVVIENYRPGTMEKLGLGYDKLKEINPSIIYAAVSGFGHTGPYSNKAAYDAVIQAMSGLMSVTGQKEGNPTRVGTSISDINAGLFATIGILAALNYRNQTGIGQKVDVAMLDSSVAILENAVSRYLVNQEIPKPSGNRHKSITPFESYKTSDGEIMIAAGNDVLFRKLCQLFGKEEWINDEKFKSNYMRTENVELLEEYITEITVSKTTTEWQILLDQYGIPNSPINTVDKVLENPQIIHREMIQEVEHPTAGKTKILGVPIKLSESPGKIISPSPTLGQHTGEILKDLIGITDEGFMELLDEDIF